MRYPLAQYQIRRNYHAPATADKSLVASQLNFKKQPAERPCERHFVYVPSIATVKTGEVLNRKCSKKK